MKNLKQLSLTGLFLASSSLALAVTLPVDLGTAGNFTVLSKAGIATGGSTIVGNIGVAPAAATYITGFGLTADASNQFSRSSLVDGKVYAADYTPPTPAIMTTAISDMEAAYTDAAGRPAGATELFAGSLGGQTLVAKVYKWSSGVNVAGTLTLAGGANDIWIFQIAQNLTMATGAQIVLIGGAQAKNIFWQVAGTATLNTTSVFHGNILCQTNIVLDGAALHGKALAQTAVTMTTGGSANSAASGYSGPNPPGKGQTFAYPSPVKNGFVNIVYEMATNGEVLIRIWNENGDLAASLRENKLAGTQKSQVSVKDFAPGVYLYKVTMAYDDGQKDSLAVKKFAVAK